MSSKEALARCDGELPAQESRVRSVERAAELDQENLCLGGAVVELRSEVAFWNEESQRLAKEKLLSDAQNMLLSRACVVYQSFQEALELEEVLRFTKEIVINLVGTEHFGVYVTAADGSLVLLAQEGVEEPALRVLTREGALARAFDAGRAMFADEKDAPPDSPQVIIPLIYRGRELGAILIFSLLPHKPHLDASDRELIDLLSPQAARALYVAFLQAHAQGASVAELAALFEDLKGRTVER